MDKNYKPGHKLAAFIVIIVMLYGLMAIGNTWTPRLGLDLRGGTTVTLTARTTDKSATADSTPSGSPSTGNPTDQSGAPSTEAMNEALTIIQQRVDSLGVGEAAVTLEGNRQIQVAVPNVDSTELTNLVGQTAQLGFRRVYAVTAATTPTPTDTTTSTPGATDTATTTPGPTDTATTTPAPSATESVGPASTPPSQATAPTTAPTSTPTTAPTDSVKPPQRVAPALPTAPPTVRPTAPGSNTDTSFDGLMNWQPTNQDQSDFAAWNCGDPFPDVWDQPLFACDTTDTEKYLLGPVILPGQRVKDAKAGIPQGQLAPVVTLSFDAQGTTDFGTATAKLVSLTSPLNQFAIVLDAKVVSAPRVNDAIPGGNAEISGSFTDQQAQDLARILRYGALPLAFDVSSVDTVSPTLGGEQLRAGIIAGIIGLILTLLYALLYYRALAIIVVGSLASAAVITYSMIVLLGSTVGFALNLPGIAGAILAIGVTADSFIVYFERIRDEIRDGYSLAHAVESGWTKARGTIVVADAVQLLSAVVLFFLAIGSVRGFAFTLLVTTLIDLFIVFFFSKPLMTLLARTEYFRSGHPLSGFDPDHLGVSPEALRGRRASVGTVKARIAKEA